MRAFQSLHAKILLGYCVVGGLFVILVMNSLFEFRTVKAELARQQQVLSFYDAVRNARRLEKNFLLYGKIADLREASEQVGYALDHLEGIRSGGPTAEVDEADVVKARGYLAALLSLLDNSLSMPPSPELADTAYKTGFTVLKLGERLDSAAKSRVAAAQARHDADLHRAIATAVMLALVAGVLVTRSVVRPLREIESGLARVARGEVERVDGPEAGQEVESLTRSINDTIQELEVRQENQARASRLMAMGTMLSGVAHELNNPLSNISSSCQILEEEWDRLPAHKARQLLEQIDDQALRAQRIVSGLLDFSRSRPLQRRPEKLHGLVEEALQLAQGRIPPSVKVRFDIDDNVNIDVDRMRFQQVVVNLLANATEAIGDSGTVRLRGWRTPRAEAPGAILEVEDDGPGIPLEHQKRIFDPFFTTKPVGKGTGLGLAVAHEIVTQHGGLFTVESKPGAGARFRILIPDRSEERLHA